MEHPTNQPRHAVAGAMIALLTVECGVPTGTSASGSAAVRSPPPLVAELAVDVSEGDFPRRVVFDASPSALGAGDVTYEWSFGDGTLTHDGPNTVHTYVGAGEFVASLTLDDGTGRRSTAEVTINVSTPDCPGNGPPLTLGDLEDDELNQVSDIAASRLQPGAYWVAEDIDEDTLVAVDLFGNTLSEHDLAVPMVDCEDLATVVDPATGVPLLFLGDIGDNDSSRAEVALWILEEPDPLADGEVDPIEVRLTYPDGPLNAETLFVDPLTLDAFVLTKGGDDGSEVFVKRAPHDEGGPFELEALGAFDALDFTATGGDVSVDGLEVVVRGYDDIARVWVRDGYRPLEEVFEDDPCEVDIYDEEQGEAVTFTLDGRGLVTTCEADGASLWWIGI